MRVVNVTMKFYRLVDVDSEVLPFKKVNNKKLNDKVRAYTFPPIIMEVDNGSLQDDPFLCDGAIFHVP